MNPQILGDQGAPDDPSLLAIAPPARPAAPVTTFQVLAGQPAAEGVPYHLPQLDYGDPYLRAPRVIEPVPAAPSAPLSRAPLSSVLGQFGIGTAAPPPALAVTPTAPQPPSAPAATAAPAAPPRGAQAPRAAGPAKLSEIGQIQEKVAGARVTAAGEAFNAAGDRIQQTEDNVTAAQGVEANAAAARVELAGKELEQATTREGEAATEREARRQAAEETTAKLAAAQTELDGTKLDIDAAYGGAAGRIFSGLAVAFGSFGASMTGGPNYALQIVNDRVNREIDAQKNEIDKKKGKVTELGRLLQQNENLLGDATAARKLARAQTYTALASEMETRYKGAALGPQQREAINALRATAATEMAGLQKDVVETIAARNLVGANERRAQAVAKASEAARQRRRGEGLEDALALESGKKQIAVMFPDPEVQAKVTGRATAMAKEFDDKGLATGPGLFQNIMTKIGVDPITGAVDPAAKVPGYTFGRPTPGASLFDSDVRELDRLKGETVEMLAKATGGVVTGSDREGAVIRMKSAATLGEFRAAVKSVYGDFATKTRLFASADPPAFAILARANPQLAALANYGATTQAAAAAGLRPAGQ